MASAQSPLNILARDPGSLARAGVLRTAHGEVRTPAFVPLATKATIKGLTPNEVRDLGYDMVLGNTYHLFLEPGHEVLVAEDGPEVARLVRSLTPERAGEIGRNALRRVLTEHTYAHRALQVELLLTGREFDRRPAARRSA